MGTQVGKDVLRDLDMINDEINNASESDLIIAVSTASEEVFRKSLAKIEELINHRKKSGEKETTYPTLTMAVEQNPSANVCIISVPGEYARGEAEKALNAGLHTIIFSSNVSFEDERAIKELARKQGLLCMGPDCGVVNLNGVAFVLGSINNRGPFGLCGASGIGIQLVGALMHKVGSGISQAIGTGGNDTKDPIGGITMLMGIDALENDPETKYIVLVSRKPGDTVLKRVLDRVSCCKKPVVIYFMGCSKDEIEKSGAIWASNLEDAARKALALIGKKLDLGSEKDLMTLAAETAKEMNNEQKYVRGAFLGGTYCDEAMRVMREKIGDIFSNAPLSPELRLKDSYKSVKNSVIDYGEEEFTRGRPHPTMEPSVRKPAIMKEARDPEVAVLLLDFVLTPPGPIDPVGDVIEDIKGAMKLARERGGKLAVVASVCGTDADLQNLDHQESMLRDAGVLVCPTNYRAALLAGEIIRVKNERNRNE
ncbi:hypothetical protein [Sediminispirochaeta smaragdinae]|nr:hypothetical protein [Sediminispirochaeta smaragdinae]